MGVANPTGIEASPVSYSVAIGPDASDSPIKRAAITTAAGDATIVAAGTATQKIRVLSFYLIVKTTAVDITFQSGTGGTALTGAMTPNSGVLFNGDWNPHGHFETAAGALLNLHQSATSQISGYLTYQLVDGTND